MVFYALGLVGHATVEIVDRVFYSRGDTRTPVLAAVLAVGINIAASLVLMQTGLSFRGLALANSIAALIEASVLIRLISIHLPGLEVSRLATPALRILAASLVMGLPVAWLASQLDPLLRPFGTPGQALLLTACNSAGALLLAVLVTCLAYAVYRNSRRGRDIVVACLLGVCAMGIYSVVTQLALDGYLGQTLQRTQIGQSTSQTPMAGRPEYGATFALMHAHPTGLGPGVLPSGNDVQVGKTGLANLGVVPNGSYVDGYMFHDAFEVHSVAGDLWVQFGVPGLILAGMILVALVRATLMMYRSKPSGDTALCLFLMFAALWDLLFSPLDANFRVVAFAAGVALWVIAARTTTNATTNATGRV
jgi:hypothetical protein